MLGRFKIGSNDFQTTNIEQTSRANVTCNTLIYTCPILHNQTIMYNYQLLC